MIAKVIVNLALDREFDYQVPDGLVDRIQVGSRVRVSFRRRYTDGIVVGLADHSEHAKLNPILDVEGDLPFVSESLLELARWMSEYYCSPMERAVRTVLPGPVWSGKSGFKRQLVVRLSASEEGPQKESSPLPQEEKAGRNSAAKLSTKQQAVVEALEMHKCPVPLAELTAELGISAAPVKSLERKGVVLIEDSEVHRDPLAGHTILRTDPLELMAEQAAALEEIQRMRLSDAGSAPHVLLLYGVTGSGKTEVYLQAIDAVRERGQGAIVLVPEISLTPQTVERFVARFGTCVAVLHSHLSDGERHDEWHRIRSGKADIVVGARSAVFAPVRDLGIIVVDEEHEHSYKQEDAPRYNARDVAVMRGRLEGCPVVLGSATPCLESWQNALTGKYRLSTLPHRADNRRMPVMRVVDMRMEAQRTGRVSVFSGDLMEAMRQRLERAEQTILFLNRRGFSTSLMCPACGYVSTCTQCSVSHTYHKQDDILRCHICGDSCPVPAQCPGCADKAFRYAGIGTQRVEIALRRCFPQARVARMDTDSTRCKASYSEILGDFRAGKTDILIGTQMIAKGLHFPSVTLVGVVYADLSLHLPDFRAGERTFQLLAQVAGRAGRGEVPGEVIVQTYTPFHAAVQAARRLDYEGFCDQELEFRKELSYPPAARLTCITLRGPSENRVAFAASAFARELTKRCSNSAIVSDASPAPLTRAKGQYRYQVMVRTRATRKLSAALRGIMQDLKLPDKVIASIDVDALSLL